MTNGRRSLYIFYAQTRFRSDESAAVHKAAKDAA